LISLKLALLFFPLFFCMVSSLQAMDITLRWAPIHDPNLAGYKVFFRDEGQSYDYNTPYWESTEPECTIYDLDITKTYYFVVKAFDLDGKTSDNSNEVALVEGMAVNVTDDDVGSGGGGSGCFVATAAYGSLMEPYVKRLFKFRDRYLRSNRLGKTFVKYNYKYLPSTADFIDRLAGLMVVACVVLLPLVVFSWVMMKINFVVVNC
jgi:hypothetical protein